MRYPRAVLCGWSVAAILACFGASEIDFETSTESVLDRSGSAWQFYLQSLSNFGGDEVLTLLIDGERPFDRNTLREVLRVSEELQDLAGIRRVDSLATVPLIHSLGGRSITLKDALRPSSAGSAGRLEDFAAAVRTNRAVSGMFVSSDERAFAVNIALESGAENFYSSVLLEVEKSIAGLDAWISGVPMFRIAADSRSRSDLLFFVPLTVVLIGSLLALLFCTPQAVALSLGTSGLGTMITFGAMGLLEVPIGITTVFLPSVLLALGCAYSIHLLSSISSADMGNRQDALLEVSFPIALSGLTTTLGFLAMYFVRIEAIRNVGTFGAIGVLSILVVSLTAGPAVLSLWPCAGRATRFREVIQERTAAKLVQLVQQNRNVVVASWVCGALIFSFGISRVRIETDVTQWFDPEEPIRIAYETIRDRLSGISPLNVVVASNDGRGVHESEVIRAIDGLSHFLDDLPAVGRSVSIGDALRQLHGVSDRDARFPTSLDEAVISQYLFLLEMNSSSADLITRDRSAANIKLRVNDNRSNALLDVAEAAERWWAQNGVEGYSARSTGIMYEFARAQDAIAFGQLKGLAFAFVTMLGIFIATFRWLRLALIALVSNVVPIAMGFGLMGLVGLPIDAGTVVIGSLAFGIAVDDSIHVVTRYGTERAMGRDVSFALRSSYRAVLPPLVYTTAVVALGFTVLAASNFAPIRSLGCLTSFLMVVCLLADVSFLPALLSYLDSKSRDDECCVS